MKKQIHIKIFNNMLFIFNNEQDVVLSDTIWKEHVGSFNNFLHTLDNNHIEYTYTYTDEDEE